MRYSLAAAILLSAGPATVSPAPAAVPGKSGPPDQTGPQTATPPPPPADQQAHRDVVAPPAVGDTGIKQGAPAPQEFPMPVFRPPPGTSAPPQR